MAYQVSGCEVNGAGTAGAARGASRGSGIASAAANRGIPDVIPSAVWSPSRSPMRPTTGDSSDPTPHAKPIINDDTVAALTGASCWPNVTLIGSVGACERTAAHMNAPQSAERP